MSNCFSLSLSFIFRVQFRGEDAKLPPKLLQRRDRPVVWMKDITFQHVDRRLGVLFSRYITTTPKTNLVLDRLSKTEKCFRPVANTPLLFLIDDRTVLPFKTPPQSCFPFYVCVCGSKLSFQSASARSAFISARDDVASQVRRRFDTEKDAADRLFHFAQGIAEGMFGSLDEAQR